VASLWGLACGGGLQHVASAWSPLPGGTQCWCCWFPLPGSTQGDWYLFASSLFHLMLLVPSFLLLFSLLSEVTFKHVRYYFFVLCHSQHQCCLASGLHFFKTECQRAVLRLGTSRAKHQPNLSPPRAGTHLRCLLHPQFSAICTRARAAFLCITALCYNHQYLVLVFPEQTEQLRFTNRTQDTAPYPAFCPCWQACTLWEAFFTQPAIYSRSIQLSTAEHVQ